jgi:hypothetical protein
MDIIITNIGEDISWGEDSVSQIVAKVIQEYLYNLE